MSAANILLYLVLIGYVLFKKVQGQPVKAPKRLLALPIVLIVLGFTELTGGPTMKPSEIAVIAVGAVLSFGLGLLRGRADKLSTRDGVRFVQWGKASLALFGANIVTKLVLDIIGVAAGGNASAVEKSLLFTLGLTLLGEALVLLARSGSSIAVIKPQSSTDAPAHDGRSRFAPSPPSQSPSVGNAIAEHHRDHRERHAQRHARRHDRSRS
jgi:hypothetical protein